MSRPCRFEMSKHSIRTGRLSRLSDSRRLSSASIRRSRFCSAAVVSCVSASSRVLGGELGETLLLAARRRPHLDRRAAELREEAGERLGVGQVGRDDQLRRHARGSGVVLEAEALEDRLRGPAPRRSRGGTRSGRSAGRRGAGTAAPRRGRRRRRGRSRRSCRPPACRRPDAARGSRSRAAGCGSASRPRTAPPPPPRASSPRASGRSCACRRRGSRSRRRSARGSPPSRSRRCRAPCSARCGSRGRGCRSGGPASAPRTAGTGRRG